MGAGAWLAGAGLSRTGTDRAASRPEIPRRGGAAEARAGGRARLVEARGRAGRGGRDADAGGVEGGAAREVKAKLDQKTPFVFIDCRNPNEFEITKIEGATLMPLPQIAQYIGQLRGKENDEIVVHCKSGGRSLQFTQILRQQGFKNVRSMAGGVLLWNKDINPGGPQY